MMPEETHTAPAPVADPAPLGLAAFALTTFLLSAINAGWATNTTGFDWWGYAIAYGGLVQLLAGMWEFRNRNVFGATAFSTYGGFWIGVGLWLHFVAGPVAATAGVAVDRDLAWILLAFAIFNTYMLIISTQVTKAVFGVFLTLEVTEILLFIGLFTTKTPILPPHTAGLVRAGGYVGVLTALVAWYASAAGVMNGHKGRAIFPVGRPFGAVAAAPAPEPAAHV
jgi:uncharacterized protein